MLSVIHHQKVRPRRYRLPIPVQKPKRDILAAVKRRIRKAPLPSSLLKSQRRRRFLEALLGGLSPLRLFAALRGLGPRLAAKPLAAAGLVLALSSLPLLAGAFAGVLGEGLFQFPGDGDLETLLNGYVFPEEEAEQPADSREPRQDAFPALSVSVYKVRPGETLTGLAQRFKLNIDTLVSFNGIKDARKVVPGTALSIPSQDGTLYTVRWGDSVEKISRNHRSELNKVLDVNNLQSSNIQPGQNLFIPGARMRPMDLKKVLGELFIYPTAGVLSSNFGIRNDPFTGIRRFHNGIDLANDSGTPILAAMPGRVAKIGYHPNYGRYIILGHSDGYQTWYAHLSAVSISAGQKVAQGQKIAEMGSTGYSTGPHLHFSIFKNGSPVDPLRFLK